MGQLRQSESERQALLAAWEAHPQVKAYRAAMLAEAEAVGREHGTGAKAMTLMAAFSAQWTRDNGPLPRTGILVG